MTEPAAAPAEPQSDVAGIQLGIGLCHYCVVERKKAELDKAAKKVPAVNTAITMVPGVAAIPVPGGQNTLAAVPLPACYTHVPTAPARNGLLLAQGGI